MGISQGLGDFFDFFRQDTTVKIIHQGNIVATPTQPPGLNGMEYLADMFKACASGETPESAGLMETPISLPKIKQLSNKKKPKPKRRTTRKRTLEELELPDDDELGDEDYEDPP
ncbi:hypothetical protein KCU61_g3130, partial [Aureobasidium melanogenum]